MSTDKNVFGHSKVRTPKTVYIPSDASEEAEAILRELVVGGLIDSYMYDQDRGSYVVRKEA